MQNTFNFSFNFSCLVDGFVSATVIESNESIPENDDAFDFSAFFVIIVEEFV